LGDNHLDHENEEEK